MKIFPAIDLKDGFCVRLKQGCYEKITVYDEEPVKVALRWAELGADGLHLVDLDGAQRGFRRNEPIIKEIIEKVEIPVQVGGGISETGAVQSFLAAGAEHVIVGTAALEKPDWLCSLVARFGGKVIVSIDALEGRVAIRGWQSVTAVKVVALAKQLVELGLKRIVYTDIACDGMLSGPNFQAYQELAEQVSLEIIASGGVTSLADVSALRELGLYGAIIGKALYAGRLSLEEVLRC